MEIASTLVNNHINMPAMPAVAPAPPTLPSMLRNIPLPTKTNISSTGNALPIPPRPCGRVDRRSGSGSGSPSITAMMRVTPALMPPGKSPSRKCGTMTCEMMRLAMTSGSAPSRPVPTSMRTARSFFATSRMTPSSGAPRPDLPRAPRRGWNIARWFPAASSARSARRTGCPSAFRTGAGGFPAPRFCSGLSVCVRSVTGDRSGGTATGLSCAKAADATSTNSSASTSSQESAACGAARRSRQLGNAVINVFGLRELMRLLQPGFSSWGGVRCGSCCCGPDSVRPKSTAGGRAMSRSFSTEKFCFGSWPNTFAVRLVGNERTVTL